MKFGRFLFALLVFGMGELMGVECGALDILQRIVFIMDTTLTTTLTADQQAEADRIEDILKGAASVEIRRIAELLASKENGELFGETEFQLRDILLGLGSRALDAALSERNREREVRTSAKGDTKVPV